MNAIRRRWDAFWFESAPGDDPRPALTLGICRALFFGFLFLWQLPHDFAPWGTYSSAFWTPIWLFDRLHLRPFAPETLTVVQVVWKITLALSAVGFLARSAMLVAFPLGTYLMGLPHNFGQTQHFDTLIVFVSGALAISHAADRCSIDAWLRRRAGRMRLAPAWEYVWPIRFVWVAMALIFFAAGVSKLRHSGLAWAFSDNLAFLLLRQQYHLSDGEPLTTWGIWVANHAVVARAMAASAMAIETLFPLSLFSRRARAILVPSGLAFLVGIRVLMGPTFEQFMMCYVFWVPWSRVVEALRIPETEVTGGTVTEVTVTEVTVTEVTVTEVTEVTVTEVTGVTGFTRRSGVAEGRASSNS